MKILLTFDNNYVAHAATVMESVIQNTQTKVGFIVMYFENNLSEDIRNILIEHFGARVSSLEFHSVGEQMKEHFSNTKYAADLSVNAFLRLFSPLVLKDEDQVLYLDSDLIVLGDITELMGLADPKYAVNAIAEHCPCPRIEILRAKPALSENEREALKQEENQFAKKRLLGMSAESLYFNTGVMVLNLKLWREDRLLDQILEFIATHPVLETADQDALNGTLDGNFGLLPLYWNVHPYVKMLNEYTCDLPAEELKKVKEAPLLIHFAGYKAWHYVYPHKKDKNLYWKYRACTPWPKRVESGKTLKNIFLQSIPSPLKRYIKGVLGDHNIAFLKKIIKG